MKPNDLWRWDAVDIAAARIAARSRPTRPLSRGKWSTMKPTNSSSGAAGRGSPPRAWKAPRRIPIERKRAVAKAWLRLKGHKGTLAGIKDALSFFDVAVAAVRRPPGK